MSTHATVLSPELVHQSLKGDDVKALGPGWSAALSDVPIFRELSKRHLGRVARLAELRRYETGDVVVRSGGSGDAFYVILDGEAEMMTAEGERRTLLAGEYFGELALLDGRPRSATIVASGELTVARVGRPAFLRLLKDEPKVAVGLSMGLVAIIRRLQAHYY
jgi:CRP/FNR family transcriptional regulator, cyclic AMP receptor protein